jgi:cytochrome c peroxidase
MKSESNIDYNLSFNPLSKHCHQSYHQSVENTETVVQIATFFADGSMWRFQDFVEFMNKISTDGQSRLDRRYRHAKNIGNQDEFEDDLRILEVPFS